jgi:hypothetical protein
VRTVFAANLDFDEEDLTPMLTLVSFYHEWEQFGRGLLEVGGDTVLQESNSLQLKHHSSQ